MYLSVVHTWVVFIIFHHSHLMNMNTPVNYCKTAYLHSSQTPHAYLCLIFYLLSSIFYLCFDVPWHRSPSRVRGISSAHPCPPNTLDHLSLPPFTIHSSFSSFLLRPPFPPPHLGHNKIALGTFFLYFSYSIFLFFNCLASIKSTLMPKNNAVMHRGPTILMLVNMLYRCVLTSSLTVGPTFMPAIKVPHQNNNSPQ